MEYWREYLYSRAHYLNGCLIWQNAATKAKYGGCKAKLPGDLHSKFTYVHHLAYMLANDVSRDKLKQSPNTVSHLCGHSLCIDPTHLTLEPQWVNNTRKTCQKAGFCIKHPLYPDCIFPVSTLIEIGK